MKAKQILPLVSLLRPFRWWIGITVLLAASTVLANVGLLSVSAVLISMAALQPPLLDLMVYIVGVRFFGISRALLRYSERYVSHKITFQILTRLRVLVYQRIEPGAPAGLQQYSDGQLFDRLLNDIEVLKYFYLRAVLTPAAALVVLAVCSIVLSQFSMAAMVLLLILFAFFGLAVPLGMGKLTAGKTAVLAEEREQWQTMLEDYLGGLSELKNAGRQEQYYHRLLEQLNKMAGLERALGVLGNLTANLLSYGSNIALVLALLVVIPAVQQGSLPGVYSAMVLLLIWSSFEAIFPFPQALLQLQQSMEAAAHLDALPVPEKVRNHRCSSRFIWISPFRTLPLLMKISIRFIRIFHYIADKERILLWWAPSGSGKSTLAALLVRFWEPQQGTISLGNIPLAQYPEQQLRQLIGVIEQDTFLFSATLRENLLLVNPQATEEQLQQALAFAVLKDVAATLPDGLDTYIGDNGYRLSGGQRQRVALARAWLRDCPVVILDEIFQGLDTITAAQIRHNLEQWGRGRTMIYITHTVQRLQTMEQIYVLQQGVIVEQGTADRLLQQQNSIFHQMWLLERQQLTNMVS